MVRLNEDCAESGPIETPAALMISVVVATFNRRDSLERLLQSLLNQTLNPDLFEVIVVSDGATDGTVEFVRQLSRDHPNITLLELENRGPGAARNSGARAARGRYLAFTDDDCVADKDWLEQLLLAFERSGAAAVQGRTTTDRSVRSPLSHQLEILGPMLASMPTCNAAYRRSIFLKAGGFDEMFRFAHDEDADLAWRVEDLGSIIFAPEAHIIHPPRLDQFSKCARRVRILESEFVLYYKNRVKYRKYVSPSPWRTIYWNIFVVSQLQKTKSACKYLFKPFKPQYFFLGIGLVLARWWNLLRFFPSYYRAQRFYCQKLAGSSS